MSKFLVLLSLWSFGFVSVTCSQQSAIPTNQQTKKNEDLQTAEHNYQAQNHPNNNVGNIASGFGAGNVNHGHNYNGHFQGYSFPMQHHGWCGNVGYGNMGSVSFDGYNSGGYDSGFQPSGGYSYPVAHGWSSYGNTGYIGDGSSNNAFGNTYLNAYGAYSNGYQG